MKHLPNLIIALSILLAAGLVIFVVHVKPKNDALNQCMEFSERHIRYPADAEWSIVSSDGTPSRWEIEGHILAPNAFGVREKFAVRCVVHLTPNPPEIWEFSLDGERLDRIGSKLESIRRAAETIR